MKSICLNCKKYFLHDKWEKRKFCSQKCHYEYPEYFSNEVRQRISKAQKGRPGYWLGKKRDIETNKIISEKLKGRKQPLRSKEHCNNLRKVQLGILSHKWQGERVNTKDGYIKVYSPDHPHAHYSRMFEHRLIPEKYLGRYLKPKERVHHINGDVSDNRIENLMIFKNQGYHCVFHRWGVINPGGVIFDGRNINPRLVVKV